MGSPAARSPDLEDLLAACEVKPRSRESLPVGRLVDHQEHGVVRCTAQPPPAHVDIKPILTDELCPITRSSLAEIIVLVGTAGAGGMATPASTSISARLKIVQEHSSPVNLRMNRPRRESILAAIVVEQGSTAKTSNIKVVRIIVALNISHKGQQARQLFC